MGLYQYIREQKHRNDVVGDLGKWMTNNYGIQPDHTSPAFQLASDEFSASGNWTKKTALQKVNENQKLQEIIKIEPQVGHIISDVIKITNNHGYSRDDEYVNFKHRATRLVGFLAEKEELGDCASYDAVIEAIVDLLPPDAVDLYPDGFPEGVYMDL